MSSSSTAPDEPTAKTSAPPADPGDAGDSETPSGGVKDKFREALERKRSHQAERNSDADTKDQAKIHGSHGPAAARREFRRKSGG